MELGTGFYIRGVHTMKLELDINDVRVVKNILEEVHTKWQSKTKDMQGDKNCSLENYNSHIDAVQSLGIIVRAIEEQL
jgi:hypothetical protein